MKRDNYREDPKAVLWTCGSESGLNPDSMGSLDPDPDPGGQKWPRNTEKVINLIF
jgi:hypothetical protein